MESISAHLVTHKTYGQIARVGGTDQSWDGLAYETVQVADLELTYSGSLGNQKWVSLVDQTLNTNQPCDLGTTATGSAGTAYSGVLQAGASSKVVTVDTLGMSTTLTFAVCYAETDGTATDNTWADSGIRLTVSKVTSVEYGEAHSSLPVRTWRSTKIMAATNRLPQVVNAQITYVGDLAAAEWLSLPIHQQIPLPPIHCPVLDTTSFSTLLSPLLLTASMLEVFPPLICRVLCIRGWFNH